MINKIIIELDDSPTELCHIMNKYGSDKGFGKHHYTLIYNKIFAKHRHENLNLFELGLGSNNLDIPSNMGIDGYPGASLRGWREYFSNANIYGADIDTNILFEEDRIETRYVDQLNPLEIQKMWATIGCDFDIIIDDGLHTLEGNICFLKHSLHRLNSNGLYIIEDVTIKNIDLYKQALKDLNITKYFIYIIDNSFDQFELNDGCLIFIEK